MSASVLSELLQSSSPSSSHALAYRLRPMSPAPRSLLLLLHGVGGSEHSLAMLAARADADTLVVLPRGPVALGPGQYGWFRVAFTAAGPQIVPEQAESSRIALIDFIATLQSQYGIAPERTVIAGFSQGGIMSAGVALTAPEHVAGFGLLSGRILPEIAPRLAARAQLASLRGFVAHGLYDSKLPLVWAERAQAWLDELGVAHELRLYAHDHELGAQMQDDFLTWLRAFA